MYCNAQWCVAVRLCGMLKMKLSTGSWHTYNHTQPAHGSASRALLALRNTDTVYIVDDRVYPHTYNHRTRWAGVLNLFRRHVVVRDVMQATHFKRGEIGTSLQWRKFDLHGFCADSFALILPHSLSLSRTQRHKHTYTIIQYTVYNIQYIHILNVVHVDWHRMCLSFTFHPFGASGEFPNFMLLIENVILKIPHIYTYNKCTHKYMYSNLLQL